MSNTAANGAAINGNVITQIGINSALCQTASDHFSQVPQLPEFLATRVARYYRERKDGRWGGRHILHGRTPGPDALQLSSNDYLSIARHPRIVEAMISSLANEGSSTE